jgi:hypothetical protein
MPQKPPGLPIPGAVPTGPGGKQKYPQWGVKEITQGSKYDIRKAGSDAEKQKDITAGYLFWFTSEQAAKDFVSGQEQGFFSGNLPNPLAGIAGALAAFYHAVTDGKMWRSLAWILLGVALIITGIVLWMRIPQRAAGIAGAAAGAAL